MRDAEQPARKLGRFVQFSEILIGLQKHILTQIERVFAMSNQSQEVIVDTFLPTRNEHVVGVHVPPSRFCDQVAVLNLPKDQTSAPFIRTGYKAEKTKARPESGFLYLDFCTKALGRRVTKAEVPSHPLYIPV